MPPDSAVSADVFFEENGLFEALVARLPDGTRGSFSEVQLAALRVAAQNCKWGGHAVDIRLSVPLFLKRYYMVMICGEERRSKARRATERKRHPLRTMGNFLFLGGIAAASFYCFSFLGTAAYIVLFSSCF